MKFSEIPDKLLHIILSYDGRIKYEKGKYVNIIHKNDERYNMLYPIVSKKNKILESIEDSGEKEFYFDFILALCFYYDKKFI